MAAADTPRPGDKHGRSAVEDAAVHAGLVAVLILLYAGIAALLSLPPMRTAMTLSLSIGVGSALVVALQNRRALCVLWADLTAWIGFAFLLASLWNTLFGRASIAIAIDLGLGLLVLLLGFSVARAARRVECSERSEDI